mmetsp:Transcript_46297/g.115169  ORF Transcript_46297/g.115169 Transcript_46297/m.115169 type:complete len:221 (-) Transcript_46297:451-1113(-)
MDHHQGCPPHEDVEDLTAHEYRQAKEQKVPSLIAQCVGHQHLDAQVHAEGIDGQVDEGVVGELNGTPVLAHKPNPHKPGDIEPHGPNHVPSVLLKHDAVPARHIVGDLDEHDDEYVYEAANVDDQPPALGGVHARHTVQNHRKRHYRHRHRQRIHRARPDEGRDGVWYLVDLHQALMCQLHPDHQVVDQKHQHGATQSRSLHPDDRQSLTPSRRPHPARR